MYNPNGVIIILAAKSRYLYTRAVIHETSAKSGKHFETKNAVFLLTFCTGKHKVPCITAEVWGYTRVLFALVAKLRYLSYTRGGLYTRGLYTGGYTRNFTVFRSLILVLNQCLPCPSDSVPWLGIDTPQIFIFRHFRDGQNHVNFLQNLNHFKFPEILQGNFRKFPEISSEISVGRTLE